MGTDFGDKVPLPEQLYTLLEANDSLDQGENVEGIRTSIIIDTLVEVLVGQKDGVEKVCANSEIREIRTFSRKDITKFIVLFAKVNELDLSELEVSSVVTDENGSLLVMEIKYSNPDGSYQLFNYTIKGRHDRNQSATTNIDRTFFDADGIPEGGEIITEYLNGEWDYKE